ncbi:hypothetical protein BAE31_08980 [Bacillus sp. I-2]|nr:hypothetical protein BAE31_08980 [Bacillus sp. I-2]
MIGGAIALILPVVLIQMFGYGEDTVEQTAGATSDKDQVGEKMNASMNNEKTIPAPLAGKVLPLSEVPDAVFSSGAMGKGFAIEPTDNKLYAPFDGSVVMLAPTKHAIGLRSEFGVELLVHVGIDTVSLDGSAFTLHIKEGSKVKKGDLLMTFDQVAIESKGLKTITPVIITNTQAYEDVIVEEQSTCQSTDVMITIVK